MSEKPKTHTKKNKMWIGRDGDGCFYLFSKEPVWSERARVWLRPDIDGSDCGTFESIDNPRGLGVRPGESVCVRITLERVEDDG